VSADEYIYFFARQESSLFRCRRATRYRFNYKRPFDSNLNIKKDLCGGERSQGKMASGFTAAAALYAVGASDSLMSMVALPRQKDIIFRSKITRRV